MINAFLNELNQEIKRRIESGFLDEEYFTTWKYNRDSVAHSRMQAIIVHVCYKLGYDVEVERAFHYRLDNDQVRFRPDMSIYRNNEVVAFIEYESTNSSDARFYDMEGRKTSDLRCLKYYASDRKNTIPKYWIIISTLPKGAVERKSWRSYELLKRSDEFRELIQSPFDFYFPTYIEETEKVIEQKKIYTTVCLLNLDRSQVRMEYRFPGSH